MFVDFALTWWHWIVFGIFLLVLDIAIINIYYLLWFGAGAVLTGIVIAVWPEMAEWAQLVTWGALSSMLLAAWLLLRKRRGTDTNSESERRKILGQLGTVVNFADGRGSMRLQRPFGGRDIWDFRLDGECAPGERVIVRSVDYESKELLAESTENKENK